MDEVKPVPFSMWTGMISCVKPLSSSLERKWSLPMDSTLRPSSWSRCPQPLNEPS